ncbi:helix-turn-helix transcriptional regulator [Alkalicella caledoniensis]|uniref:Helix-turn-helix transcriptional regulator n=1 Tax=Alkalicella caledoniensis TaxID=2731377 RepID=A0A7G9W9H6_ALKCA|nr:helix-turn-helix transcriptional regulator [Alkalicella caledoniensis]QNO15338.1 helix-turn-helix transcriptional regulator [Alkalicella caledoniensis]
MNLGEKILDLKTKSNMSQGDLADTLNVSRQSVSKWETNTSVPELDKLLKMSDIFNVSLDELARGRKTISESNNVVNKEQTSGFPLRKIIGLGLLGVGFIIFAVLLVVDLLMASILALPFIITGLITSLVRRHAALYCGWALYIMLYWYFRSFTAVRILDIFNILMYLTGNISLIIIDWIMAIALVALLTRTSRLIKRSENGKSYS